MCSINLYKAISYTWDGIHSLAVFSITIIRITSIPSREAKKKKNATESLLGFLGPISVHEITQDNGGFLFFL